MIYIMLCNMTQTTRDRTIKMPNLIDYSMHNVGSDENHVLSHYATLGRYDLVVFAEAESELKVAQLSIALSNRTGMNIETLPTMNMNNLEERSPVPVSVPEPSLEEPVAINVPYAIFSPEEENYAYGGPTIANDGRPY